MKKLFLLGGMLLMLTSCDITDYFMDESGAVKHKDGTTVEQTEIDGNAEAIEARGKLGTKTTNLT